MKSILAVIMLLITFKGIAQTCGCEKEFLHIKYIVEQNFSGFADRIKTISKEPYDKKVDGLLKLTHDRFAGDNCLLIINKYLDIFKSHHLGFYSTFDPYITDTSFTHHRPVFTLTDSDIERVNTPPSEKGGFQEAAYGRLLKLSAS